MPSQSITTEAIVLKSRPRGAQDLLLIMLTPKLGRLPCIAKSGRNSFKRFGGCLNLFSEIEGLFTVRDGMEVGRLESAMLLEPFEGIRRGMPSLSAASAGAELCDRLSYGIEGAEDLYHETKVFFSNVSKGGTDRSLASFSIRALAIAGFRPELYKCVFCGKPSTETMTQRAFDIHRGGLMCPECYGAGRSTENATRRISGWVKKELVSMLEAGEGSGWECPPARAAECCALVSMLVAERLGSPLRTLGSPPIFYP